MVRLPVRCNTGQQLLQIPTSYTSPLIIGGKRIIYQWKVKPNRSHVPSSYAKKHRKLQTKIRKRTEPVFWGNYNYRESARILWNGLERKNKQFCSCRKTTYISISQLCIQYYGILNRYHFSKCTTKGIIKVALLL